MSEKKTPETPVDKYFRLTKSLKHSKKALESAQRDVDRTEKELSMLLKRLWFCPQCNHPQQIPNKKDAIVQLESKLNEDNTESFYKCKYVKCVFCEKMVLIDKVFMGDDD